MRALCGAAADRSTGQLCTHTPAPPGYLTGRFLLQGQDPKAGRQAATPRHAQVTVTTYRARSRSEEPRSFLSSLSVPNTCERSRSLWLALADSCPSRAFTWLRGGSDRTQRRRRRYVRSRSSERDKCTGSILIEADNGVWDWGGPTHLAQLQSPLLLRITILMRLCRLRLYFPLPLVHSSLL